MSVKNKKQEPVLSTNVNSLPTNNVSLHVQRWKEWHPGFPMSIDANAYKNLPRDIQFDSEKGVDFVLNYSKAYVQCATTNTAGVVVYVIKSLSPWCC